MNRHVSGTRARPATVIFLGAVLAGVAGPSLGADGYGFYVGTEYTSGEYGGDESIDELYVPVSVWGDFGRISLRLTVPWLSVDAPTGTIIEGPGGIPIVGDGPRTTESGLGDIVASATIRDVWTSQDRNLVLDLTGRAKLPTADEDKGLGTGETDFTLQADAYRFLDRVTLLGSLGYVLRGDPDDYSLDDGIIAMLGATSKGSQGLRTGVFLEYRQAGYATNDDRLEVLGSLGWSIDQWRMGAYLLAGLSDSAPDWGAGLTIGVRY